MAQDSVLPLDPMYKQLVKASSLCRYSKQTYLVNMLCFIDSSVLISFQARISPMDWSKTIQATARDRVMQLAAAVCNTADFAQKAPASAKLKGITPSSSEEGKSTQVLQAPGSHTTRTASNAALSLAFLPSCSGFTSSSIKAFQL